MPGTKPGIDGPTGRVVVLIVLLFVAGGALRGYLPASDGAPLARAGGNRAALIFVVAALAGALAVMAVSIIARLRDPHSVAPNAGNLSETLGRGVGRPNWRVVLIGLGVILAWLLIAFLLARLFASNNVSQPTPLPDSGATSSAHGPAPPPDQQSQDNPGDVFGILLAGAVPLLLLLVAAAAITSRRWRTPTPGPIDNDPFESPARPEPSESLVRAADIGLAEMADRSREPRQAIIACYAAMERELANVPEAAPQDFDTATEVLARAVDRRALRTDSAVQLVTLFAEARFSPHVMNEGHREVAVRVLQLVRDELNSRSAV